MFKPVTDLRCEATVSGVCGDVAAMASRREEASAGGIDGEYLCSRRRRIGCRRPLALLFSPSPLDGVQRAVYGERAAELRTKAAHGSKETILRAQNCSQVVAIYGTETHKKSRLEFGSLSPARFHGVLSRPARLESSTEGPPGAMEASPCVFVSDLAARKTLGIPKQPRQGLITRTTRTTRAAEIRINSSQAAADAAIANGNRYAAKRASRLQAARNAAVDNKQA